MNTNFSAFSKRISSGFFFRQFLLLKLPSAYFAGLKIEAFDETNAIISVKQKWFNKNPFGSIYFGVLTMAAEMSTGILCLGNIYNRRPGISMLVIEQKALFHKKAMGKILFTCEDGNKISAAIEEAVTTGNAVTVTCYSQGMDSSNNLVAEFWVTWSFKQRSSKAVTPAVSL
ncbi:MAG: thioesterase [Parafilimonas sp.]